MEGHALVAAVKDNYILGWPVTLSGEPSFSPGMLFRDARGDTVTVWPTRETGLGLHLLGQPLGPLLDVKTIRGIAASLDDGETPSGLLAPPIEETGADVDNWSTQMTDHWAALCFHTGGTFGTKPYLNPARVSELGGSAREVGRILGLTPPQVRTLWEGERHMDPEILKALSEHYHVESHYLTRSNPAQSLWDLLASPEYKEAVEHACRQRRVGEEEIRAEVTRSAFALAARQDHEGMADQKLRDALQRAACVGPER